MSDVDADMIACWRTNYGLHMTPHELAAFWDGGLPAGCAMALKVACDRIESATALLRQALDVLQHLADTKLIRSGGIIAAIRARLGEKT